MKENSLGQMDLGTDLSIIDFLEFRQWYLLRL